jgi:uncharacterized membrane protein YdjX (TVP38/TMEM64 family)
MKIPYFRYPIAKRSAKYVVLTVIIVAFVVALLSSQSSVALLQVIKHIVQPFAGWAPFIFIVLYILLGLVGFSTSVMSLSAILLFAPIIAFLCILIGGTVTAFFAFMVARSAKIQLAFPAVKSLRSQRTVVYVTKQIERQTKVHGFRLVFLLRLMRLPYIALSYAAGFSTQITTRHFVLATLLSNAISATILVLIGVVAVVYFAFATALVIGSTTVYVLWKRYRKAAQ